MKRWIHADVDMQDKSDSESRYAQAHAIEESDDIELLEKLANDASAVIRRAVAINESTPSEILTELAHDSEWFVRDGVAHNSNTSPEVLAELAYDTQRTVRAEVAQNKSTPSEVLIKLADDPYEAARAFVAMNPNTPLEIVTELIDDPDKDVRNYAKKSINSSSVTRGSAKRCIYTSKDGSKLTWKALQDQLQEQFDEYGALPLYDKTEASKELNNICREAESEMNVIVEYPDSNRKKNVVIKSKDGSIIGKVQYQYFNDDVLNWVFNTRSKSDFKKRYKAYLEAECE